MLRKLVNSFKRFMFGRYGFDQLNMVLLAGAVLLSVINTVLSMFLRDNAVFATIISPIFYGLMAVLLGLNIFRCLSRNIYKRRQENRRMLNFVTRLKDRQHRYFRCPGCKQRVRVPRGKGKLSIRCPKCGNKFLRKT